MASSPSTYHTAVSLYSPSNLNFSSSSVIRTGWKKIWRINAIFPRVRLFIWKTCSNSFCELCGEKAKMVDHILLPCTTKYPVWYSSLLRVDTKNMESLSFKELSGSVSRGTHLNMCPCYRIQHGKSGRHETLNTLRIHLLSVTHHSEGAKSMQ